MKLRSLLSLPLILTVCVSTLSHANTPNCKEVVQQPSQEWINKASGNGSTPDIMDAVAAYGKCVDETVAQIREELNKAGTGPLMGANGNFRDLQEALHQFNKVALPAVAVGGSWDETQAAYAKLYEKQFDLAFYASYMNRMKNPLVDRFKKTERPNLRQTKLYFVKVIRKVPMKQRSSVTKAFNELLSIAVSENQLSPEYVYDYAIFILQSPEDPEFSPAPF